MCAGIDKQRNTLQAILLGLLLAGCADLRVANEAYLAKSYDEAYQHWSSLARKGFPEAHYRLAVLLAEGHMGKNRESEALFHFQQAINLDYSRAAIGLGRFLIRHAGSSGQTSSAIAWLEESAARGLIDARLALADLRLDGTVVERDSAGALQTLVELAENGEARAIYRLGTIYEQGLYVPPDPAAAAGYFRRALELDHVRAGIHLAELYEQGRGVEPDAGRAREILTALKDRGDPGAAYALAGLIERENPDSPMPDQSLALYRATSMAGYPPATLRLARIHLNGEGVPQDIPRAIALLERMSAEGYGPATAQLGDIYRDGDHQPKDYARAFSLYQRSLLQFFDRAELRIADLLRNGWGVPQDLQAARVIYARFANQGDPGAAYSLAGVIEQEAGEGEFPEAALSWYRAAAKTGHQAARMRLAELALSGLGVQQNVPEALEIFETLSDEEYAKATETLGELYRDGAFVERDHARAESLFHRADQQGAKGARFKLGDLYAWGDPEVQDFSRAAAIYRELITAGSLETSYKLARLHEARLAKNNITREIVDWYRSAAEAGYTPAQIRLADLTLEGLGMPQDVDAALAVFSDLAASGIGAATHRLGRLREFGGDRLPEFEEAVAFYQEAMQQGYEASELKLAVLYAGQQDGAGLEKAISILTRFAEKNDVRAAFELGEIHADRGAELRQDWQAEARKWYRRAIELGSNDARLELARMIENAAGRPTAESMKLMAEAANSGHGSAMLDYGRRLYRGGYLERNVVEGLALVPAAARMQTTGAMQTAIDFMNKLEDQTLIDTAQVRSDQIWTDWFVKESGAAASPRSQLVDQAENGS